MAVMFKLFEGNFFISLFHPFNKNKRREIRANIRLRNFHKKAPLALIELSNAIADYKKPVKIWLEFGSLLGAYRENAIIAHDTDIDVGIYESDMTDDFILHLEKKQFKLIKKYIISSSDNSLNGFRAEYTFQYKKDVSIDFFVFKEEGCKRFCFSFDKEDGLTRDETLQKYNGMLRTIKILLPNFEFDKISFLGANFLIPSHTELYLKEIYGNDFMIPKKYNYENRIKDYEILLENTTLGQCKNYEV